MRLLHPSLIVTVVLALGACNQAADSKTKTDSVAPGTSPPPPAEVGEVAVKTDDSSNTDDKIVKKDPDGPALSDSSNLQMVVVQAGQVALTTDALNLAGQSAPDKLESLQYAISSIQICKSLQVMGSGFSNPEGCLTIFSDEAVDLSTYAKAKADTTHYFDLMNPASLAKLTATTQLKPSDAHEYKYGVVNWAQPYKVKASVAIYDPTSLTPNEPATTLYTKDGEIYAEMQSGCTGDSCTKHVTKADAITTGPADLAIVWSNKGGNWFQFAKPFVITDADLTAKKQFKLDLAVNPDGMITGYTNSSEGLLIGGTGAFPSPSDPNSLPNPVFAIDVAYLSLIPIAHTAEQKVKKEVYLLHYLGATNPFDFRIELYYLDGDPKKTIYGETVRSFVVPASTERVPVLSDINSVEQTSTGEILLKTSDTPAIQPISDFIRLTTTGQTGTAHLTSGKGICLTEDQFLCGTANFTHTVDLTYELVDIYELP